MTGIAVIEADGGSRISVIEVAPLTSVTIEVTENGRVDTVEVVPDIEPHTIDVLIPGLRGPPGLDGAAVASFEFTQATPTTPWTITHMLGHKPIIDIRSAGGVEMVGDVVHISDNQTNVYFNTPQAGTARLI